MVRETFHLSDEDLLRLLDGELSRRRGKQAQAHLIACCLCRSRLRETEGTIADFVSLHQTPDLEPPSLGSPRAILKARLREAATQPSAAGWRLRNSSSQRAAVYLGIALCLTALASRVIRDRMLTQGPPAVEFSSSLAIPNHRLTPGATRPIQISDVCSVPHEEVVRDVPSGLRQRVFDEYGIVNPHSEDFEIDYLIAPGLGGTEDIRNLWPEPAKLPAWNAHLKDELEERLHQMVCDGQLDLPTAQKAIATDWINAYKKYLGGPQSRS